jgi:hypothetical protein
MLYKTRLNTFILLVNNTKIFNLIRLNNIANGVSLTQTTFSHSATSQIVSILLQTTVFFQITLLLAIQMKEIKTIARTSKFALANRIILRLLTLQTM